MALAGLGRMGLYQDFSAEKSVVPLIAPTVKIGKLDSSKGFLTTRLIINHKPWLSETGWEEETYDIAEGIITRGICPPVG